ncbi:MAG: hypothetical protein PVG65_00160 [Candidatus Thorarchaeota archaeon]|jgi:hypothetical protein
MISNRCIIIGSGSSVRQNRWNTPIENLPIWSLLKNELTIGINWVFRWFTPTIELFGDYKFYHTEYENLKDLPLMITTKDGYYIREDHKPISPNLIFLKRCKAKKYLKPGDVEAGNHKYYWGKDSWTQGWYDNQLSGILALTFAINGLGCKEIYLLGYDATEIDGHTHFYDDTDVGTYIYENQSYCGVGKNKNDFFRTQNYNSGKKIKELNDFWFKPFEQELENGIKIYNVSTESKLNNFPKISYGTFQNHLENDPEPILQEKTRMLIKNYIEEHNCE